MCVRHASPQLAVEVLNALLCHFSFNSWSCAGHLEQTVELLLTAMFFSSLDTNAATFDADYVPEPGGTPGLGGADVPPPPPSMSQLSSAELAEQHSAGKDMMDQVRRAVRREASHKA